MTVEKASKKSVRVSAQTGDGTIGVFLLTVSQLHTEYHYRTRTKYNNRHCGNKLSDSTENDCCFISKIQIKANV